MKKESVNLFFLGKGGVGKSTCSALSAVKLAAQGNKILLVSLDPAHNLSDIFETSFSEKPLALTKNLLVKEIDLSSRIKKYLAGVQKQIVHSYRYLTSFNLQQHLDIMKYSPAMEEYALLSAFSETNSDFARKTDYIVFDMPPTALALKFFGLPGLSLVWLGKLLGLRKEIMHKREIISRVRFAKKEIERDKILNNIQRQMEDYKHLENVFGDQNKSRINLVLNPDKLSLSESLLIVKRLREYKLNLNSLYINKYRGEELSLIRKNIGAIPDFILPLSEKPLIGLEALKSYLTGSGQIGFI